MVDVDLGQKIPATFTISIWNKLLVVIGEVDIGIRSATFIVLRATFYTSLHISDKHNLVHSLEKMNFKPLILSQIIETAIIFMISLIYS